MDSIILGQTGAHDNIINDKEISYPFGQFNIKVKVNEKNEFIGIVEVNVNKSFYNYKSSAANGYHDVEEFYKD